MANPSRAGYSRSEYFSVGLSGGIGSGKSTVAGLLAQHGAAIVDTDLIARELTAPGGDAMDAIAAGFSRALVTPQGALDRDRMRDLVFREPAAKRKLEAILHPLISARAQALGNAAAGNAPYVVFVVPLLIESGHWKERADRILIVDCSEAAQIERVTRRSELEPSAVHAIIAQQASRQQRLDAADDVLVNEGDAVSLGPRVARLHARYVALATGKKQSL